MAFQSVWMVERNVFCQLKSFYGSEVGEKLSDENILIEKEAKTLIINEQICFGT